MPADPCEVLLVDAIVGIEVGEQDSAQVVAGFSEDPDHPSTTPVHGRRLADHNAGLERVLDVIKAAQPVPEFLLESGDVLPAGLVGFAGDDADELQLVRVICVDDRLHRPFEHVVGLGVGRDHAQVEVLERVDITCRRLLAAHGEPVLFHVAPHPQHGAVDAGHDPNGPQHPVGVEDQHHDRDEEGPGRVKDDRDPGGRQQQDPRHEAWCRLEKAGAELAQRMLPNRRGRLGFDHGHEPIMAGE